MTQLNFKDALGYPILDVDFSDNSYTLYDAIDPEMRSTVFVFGSSASKELRYLIDHGKHGMTRILSAVGNVEVFVTKERQGHFFSVIDSNGSMYDNGLDPNDMHTLSDHLPQMNEREAIRYEKTHFLG